MFFAALADRTRLRLLNLLKDGEVCVCFFADAIGTNNPKISRHLAYLKRAGLVSARRDGKWVHYSLVRPANQHAAAALDAALAIVADDKEMLKDKKNLENACCAPNAPVQLRRTPVKQGRAKTSDAGRPR
ncbi:MAG: ArsR/SmtB family transcription factor [Pyrinomonadaceae bacterium]